LFHFSLIEEENCKKLKETTKVGAAVVLNKSFIQKKVLIKI
jgi:hypothetical protein